MKDIITQYCPEQAKCEVHVDHLNHLNVLPRKSSLASV